MNQFYTIPNLLSLSRIILTPVFVWAFFKGGNFLLLALLVFTVAALTDSFDGYYARRYGMTTKLGSFLDPIADKILISTTLIVFAVMNLIEWWVVAVIVVRDVIITSLRLKMMYDGTCLVTSDLGKFKTVAQFIAIYVMFGGVLFAEAQMNKIWYETMLLIVKMIMYCVAALTAYSGIDYLIKFRRFKRSLAQGQNLNHPNQ